MRKTMTRKQLDERLDVARQCPSVAHLPAFGLMAPIGWDYHDPKLERRALAILAAEGITGATISETAPALFWWHDSTGKRHLHDWD